MSTIEAVHQRLREALESGEYPLGERLPSETALAHRFGVSRSAIREALRMLGAQGLIQTRNGVGTFVIASKLAPVLQFGGFAAQDLIEARRFIETPSAGLAASRGSVNEVAKLRALHDAMGQEQDDDAWVELDLQFHALIAELAKNSVLVYLLNQLRGTLATQSSFLNTVSDRRASSIVEHELIVAAIEARDEQRAVQAMRQHLDHVQQALHSLASNGAS